MKLNVLLAMTLATALLVSAGRCSKDSSDDEKDSAATDTTIRKSDDLNSDSKMEDTAPFEAEIMEDGSTSGPTDEGLEEQSPEPDEGY